MNFPTVWPQFFTATILNWKHLLGKDEYKDIITNCLKFFLSVGVRTNRNEMVGADTNH